MKNFVTGVIGVIGGTSSYALGGWDFALQTLLIFMAVDYVTGLIVAGVFKKSPKTKKGGLSSLIGWKGLCRKGMALMIVLIACRLDMLVGTDFIRDAVVIAYCTNEAISIIENAGIMGVPIPKPITNAIEALKSKGDDNNGNS